MAQGSTPAHKAHMHQGHYENAADQNISTGMSEEDIGERDLENKKSRKLMPTARFGYWTVMIQEVLASLNLPSAILLQPLLRK